MLECLSGRDEGIFQSLSAKGNFNISKLNDGSRERISQFPTISTIIKFSTSDNWFRVLWLVHSILVISSYSLVWPYMVYVAKLKMFSPESEIFPWVRPKMFFFLWWAYVCLTTTLGCYTTSHLHHFFFSISLGFSCFFRSYFVLQIFGV